jgi:hypothetical protein
LLCDFRLSSLTNDRPKWFNNLRHYSTVLNTFADTDELLVVRAFSYLHGDCEHFCVVTKQAAYPKQRSLRPPSGAVQVPFPLQLDLFELCTPELQAELKGPRAACWAIEESLKGPQGASTAQKNDRAAADKEAGGNRDSEMTGADEAGGTSDQDFTGKMTGRFDLVACLTHRGRTLDSGHYVAWVKQKGDDCWIQFDDEKLIPRKSEEILALKGGGDWHTAYLLLYKAQRVPAKEVQAVHDEAH